MTALDAARAESFEHAAIAEEYIEGEEYSCECISQNGKHQFLAITKKFTTGAPHFIETGHAEPAELTDEQQKEVVNDIFKALDALSIKNGASHSEFKIQPNGKVGIIEIGARMGGDCIGSDLVRISTGYDFVGAVLDVATGNKIAQKAEGEKAFALVKFIFNQDDIKTVKAAVEKYQDCVYYASEISEAEGEVTDSSNRLGFVIFRTADNKQYASLKNDLFNVR